MRTPPNGDHHDEGDVSRSYLIGSDLHTDRSAADTDEMFDRLNEYADEYDCDGILAPGDIGEQDTLDAFYDTIVDTVRIVRGDHDDWDMGNDQLMTDGGDVIIDDRLDWSIEIGERQYDLAMSHRSNAFGISTTEMYDNHQDPDVVLYGHGHCPLDRTLDGSLALSAGSLVQNYNVDTDVVPATSAHVLDLYEDRIELTHLDFETGEEVELAAYAWEDDELVQTQRQWTWDGDRLEYIVEGGRSNSLKHWIEHN